MVVHAVAFFIQVKLGLQHRELHGLATLLLAAPALALLILAFLLLFLAYPVATVAYAAFADEEGFAKVATLAEIAAQVPAMPRPTTATSVSRSQTSTALASSAGIGSVAPLTAW